MKKKVSAQTAVGDFRQLTPQQKQEILVESLNMIDGQVVDRLNDDDYFDDCPICQAMKKADQENRNMSVKELEDSFREAKNMGHFVGGLDGENPFEDDFEMNQGEGETRNGINTRNNPWFDEIEAWTDEEIDEFIRDQEEHPTQGKK